MSFDYGTRCLVELLTMGGAEAAAAAGHALSPCTVELLEAWQHHVDVCAMMADQSEDPRLKLHKQLAEKRKSRSKARRSRSAKEGDGTLMAAVEGEAPVDGSAPASPAPQRKGQAKGQQVPRGASPNPGAQRPPKCVQKLDRGVLRAKAQPFMPQAQPQKSLSPQARGLPDRLGDFLGN